ncbi:mitochondrial ribosomal protein L24 [Chloropicon primus]|uniref:Large ribosomal subunit protein bL28m n=1 Tax=Chloropicon primus TaxID=1764295 RepID=A0A5B8MDM7_9CHLO|nr:mitochondrial ribosomal protein L24 [Chloropicon primus]UPQ97475.1 mitochondrial ribosomal protein L24 [Chloropicon primus]|eukprot:QDZ18264.1 mitochondrial ribosomal protein L24 [Chloropicon primus]
MFSALVGGLLSNLKTTTSLGFVRVVTTRDYAAAALPSRALRGLYGGKEVQFGNKVSKDGGNKTRRKWKPNVVSKNLYSDVLEKKFKLKVTTYVLRCIKKHGSLDDYLVKTKEKNIQSEVGLLLKRRVEAALKAKGEMQRQLDEQIQTQQGDTAEGPSFN